MLDRIEKTDRTKLVKDYDYGAVKTHELDYLDKPVYAKIEFDQLGNVIYEDYTELDNYIETKLIPKCKTKISKKDKTEYYSLELFEIVKLRISELEMRHVLKYLDNKGIRVAGYSQDIDTENYDYVRTYKSSQWPLHDSNFDNEGKIKEYQQTGDKQLFDLIIKNNIRLAVYISHVYSIYTGHDVNEIQSFAFEGLIYAVNKFNSDKGYKFSTYAYPCIRGYILRGLPELDFIFHRKDLYQKFVIYRNAIEEQTGEDVFENQKLLDRVYRLMYQNGEISQSEMETLKYMLNLNNPKLEELGYELEQDYNLEIEVIFKIGREKILEMLNTLTSREKFVLEHRFGLKDDIPKDLETIGKMLGVTRERIRQIEAKALRKLRWRSKRIYFNARDLLDLGSERGRKAL